MYVKLLFFIVINSSDFGLLQKMNCI